MHALQESVRQIRGTASGPRISVCHGAAGMFDDNEIDQGGIQA